jgi:hypothetical protein
MRTIFFLGFVMTLGAAGCGTAYKDGLCKLSQSSALVATHYAEYVAAETDADKKAARQAESSQFQQAVDEAAKTCAQ